MNNITISDINNILNDRIKNDEFKVLKEIPTPDKFKDMEKATKRIVEAINTNETINLVGDYDADGICSTVIIVDFFNSLQIKINHIIPNRFEHGYGLSPKIMDLIDEGLIITVDNGISAIEAANICKSRNLDLIITDHHTVGTSIPDCFAIVNPKQEDCTFPFSDICGAQVAWYLCASIKKELKIDFDLVSLFDILSIAIVADIMPMVSLNQTMVKFGLKKINSSQRPSLLAIKKRFGLFDVTEENIGFKIAPLINCAGRMGDPNVALDFLLASTMNEADDLLDYLIELNENRKDEQLKIFNEAKLQVDENDAVVVVSSSDWNEGIVGIVASKLCEKYKKPAFVFTINGDTSKASSRSTANTHLYNLISSCSSLLNGFGGHKQAAGMSIDTNKLDEFKIMLNKNIATLPKEEEDTNATSLGNLSLTDVGSTLYNMVENYRPFGITNPYPIFTFTDVTVLNVIRMGKNKEFKRLIISDGMIDNIEVVVFVDIDDIEIGTTITFTGTVSKNDFRGVVKYNLMLKDMV